MPDINQTRKRGEGKAMRKVCFLIFLLGVSRAESSLTLFSDVTDPTDTTLPWAAGCIDPLVSEIRTRQATIQKRKPVGGLGVYLGHIFDFEKDRNTHPKVSWALDTDTGGFFQEMTRFRRMAPVGLAQTYPAAYDLLANFAQMRRGRVHLADYGGHLGIPLIHLKRMAAEQGFGVDILRTTNIDLFNWSLMGGSYLHHISKIIAGTWVSHPRWQPNLILADATTRVPLPSPPDIATVFDSIQFMEDKLAAFINIYNQLAEGGMMIVSNDEPIGPILRHSDGFEDNHVLESFLEALGSHGIAVVLTREEWKPTVFNTRTFVIKKIPGTFLRANYQFGGHVEHPSGQVSSLYHRWPAGEFPVTVETAGPFRIYK
jgi:hypothetical protein